MAESCPSPKPPMRLLRIPWGTVQRTPSTTVLLSYS